MTAVCNLECTPLAQHPKLLRVSPHMSSITRHLYGSQWAVMQVGGDKVHLSFEEVHAKQAGMQLRVRCGGQDYEIQVLDPACVADFQGALSPSVPVALQRAAVQYVLEPIWRTLELRLQMPVELVDLQGSVPAWSATQSIGIRVTRQTSQGIQNTFLLLRADSDEAWLKLARSSLTPSRPMLCMDSLVLQVRVLASPILLAMHELSSLEVGDVVVMDATAEQRDQLPVRLMLQGCLLNNVSGVLRSGAQLVIVDAPSGGKASVRVSELATSQASPKISNISQFTMTNESTTPAASTTQFTSSIDSVMVDIEIELARLTVPLGSLRTLSVGQVFDTQHSVDGQSVVLWCGGQRLGTGGLVAIGDRLGVRILALEPAVSASN